MLYEFCHKMFIKNKCIKGIKSMYIGTDLQYGTIILIISTVDHAKIENATVCTFTLTIKN